MMNARVWPVLTIKVAAVIAIATALLTAWAGYGRDDIVRWFGAFLMCG